MDREGNITEKQDTIQVMLEDVELYQSVIPSAMISSTETKVICNIIELSEPVLHHNEKDTSMYGNITEECDDVKKVML